jgi:GGDEF domain-containing protein
MSPEETSRDLDPRAPIVDEQTFTLVAELEVRQAIRLQYYVSLLVLRADTEQPWSHAEGVSLARLIADAIRDQIRSTDVVSVTPSPPHLHVLLVSTYLDNLPGIIGRIAAAVNGHTFERSAGTARLTLSMGGACFPTTARNRAELFRQAESLSADAGAARGEPGHRYRLAHRMA